MRLPLAALALLVAAGCADDATPTTEPVADAVAEIVPSGPDRAVAQIAEVDGSGVSGSVEFIDLDDAVEIRYNLSGLSAGMHGFHVHQTGDCGPDSTGTPAGAAGGHLNPLASPHGAPSARPVQRHAGDLGNVEADASGRAVGVRVDSVLAFDGPTSFLGKAMLVHGGEDDLASQPSGDAGARVGCGVIRRADEAAADTTGADTVATPAR
ncbi:superoxide dismutase family protein [Rubrivirga sp.]|uniref:superoxide dismutase family protein n=1 Tax=Rubrivirga sp. TaxID=1885344 RepID=UPI003B524C7E